MNKIFFINIFYCCLYQIARAVLYWYIKQFPITNAVTALPTIVCPEFGETVSDVTTVPAVIVPPP